MYNYGLIGNCQISALVSGQGSIDWLCMPRPDSPPVFGHILDSQGGNFSITPDGDFSSTQSYLKHTNVLVTRFKANDGGGFQVIDFCPRFRQYGRIFRPITLIRIVEPLEGECHVRIHCQPVQGWRKILPKPSRGNAHLRWHMDGEYLRLNTTMSMTHLLDESSFILNKKIYFALTWSSTLEEDLERLSEDYLNETGKYWDTWVKHCSIPSLFQEETIRSALALKLHCYEDTGAILAALTTSLPEQIGGVRNWDYRYCWLRDAYFVLSALNALGQFEEMEGFIKFLLNVVADTDLSSSGMAPVYGLDHQRPGAEVILENWQGFRESRPVRVFNQAVEHIQNDVYGEMILSLSPIFFDARFLHLRSKEYESLLEMLLRQCAMRISQPDAGLWEMRSGWREHSFSNLACWAGLDRGAQLQKLGILKSGSLNISNEIHRAEEAISKAVKSGTLRNGPGDDSVDGALLLLPVLRYGDHDLSKRTVDLIKQDLQIPGAPSGFLYRYNRRDDFGSPKGAFVACGFWLVQALAKMDQKEEGIKIIKHLLKAATNLGLYSEHFDPTTHFQGGNFPQAYSQVGLINAAFAVSPKWSDIL